MKFLHQAWRPRPECRDATPDLENLGATHTLIDEVNQEINPKIDPLIQMATVAYKRHIEEVAIELNLNVNDIIVCNGVAYRVGHFGKVEFIGRP